MAAANSQHAEASKESEMVHRHQLQKTILVAGALEAE